MAKVDMKMPEDFLEKISKLNDRFDEIAPKVLEAGAEHVIAKARSNLSEVIGKGTKYKSRATGELMASLGVTPAKQNRDGNWDIKVGIGNSKDSKGVSNALKAMVIEYGKSGQPAKPWLKRTKSSSRKDCLNEMKAKLEKELESL
jgi:hypothetical protein